MVRDQLLARPAYLCFSRWHVTLYARMHTLHLASCNKDKLGSFESKLPIQFPLYLIHYPRLALTWEARCSSWTRAGYTRCTRFDFDINTSVHGSSKNASDGSPRINCTTEQRIGQPATTQRPRVDWTSRQHVSTPIQAAAHLVGMPQASHAMTPNDCTPDTVGACSPSVSQLTGNKSCVAIHTSKRTRQAHRWVSHAPRPRNTTPPRTCQVLKSKRTCYFF